MAAILPYLEETPEETVGCFGAAGRKIRGVHAPPPAEGAVAELTRMQWMRQELADLLAEHEYTIGQIEDDTFGIILDSNIAKDAIPWSGSVGETGHGHDPAYSFFTQNKKMGCGIWDLPAGTPQIGGTCPAATPGQWIVSEAGSRESTYRSSPPPRPPRLARSSAPAFGAVDGTRRRVSSAPCRPIDGSMGGSDGSILCQEGR